MNYCPACNKMTMVPFMDGFSCEKCGRRYKNEQLVVNQGKDKRMIKRTTSKLSKIDFETGEILEVPSYEMTYDAADLKHYRLSEIKRKVKKYKVGGEYV